MKVGFLVWNQFQVAHFATIAREFVEPDFIFLDRDPKALKGFNPAWLATYGAYARFVPELMLHTLDGKYDALVSQFRPPLRKPLAKTRLLIHQYSLAKPKTAYNARWFAADHGLVYGDYSAGIIGQMCPVSKVGNPRFDPLLEGSLDPVATRLVADRLDPAKKTLLYLPTWGDLSSSGAFLEALGEMSSAFNVVVRTHHMTPLKDGTPAGLPAGIIDAATLPPMLDPGLHLLQCADLVVSDMSGAIFDALYCRKPVVLVGDEAHYDTHKKADGTAIEVSQRHRIGPFVTDPTKLAYTVSELLAAPEYYRGENEALIAECFTQRGGCALLAANAIRLAVESEAIKPALQRYAAPDFAGALTAKAFAAAVGRSKRRKAVAAKREAAKKARARARSGPSKILHGGGGRARRPVENVAATLRASIKDGDFLRIGLGLEEWCKFPRTKRAKSIQQAYAAVSAVRFSRSAWKIALAKLFDGKYAPETPEGTKLLRKCGLVRVAAALEAKMEEGLSDELVAQLDSLGSVGSVIDVAARNELAPREGQQCIDPSGNLIGLVDADASRVVETYFALSVARVLKDEAQRPYRGSQLAFVRNLFNELIKLGAIVYPRVQGGVIGATPISGDWLALTWHTLGTSVPGQFHLKLGSLFGHFVIDSKGYSGWSSIADSKLADLISDVGADVAHAHWQQLHADLVMEGKSKYSQTDERPADWGRYIFFPMQVTDDAVARLADIETLDLLKQLKAWAVGKDLNVVVKRHPMCKNREVAAAIAEGVDAGAIHVSNASVHELVAGAECVVTVNSGVGAEALLQLKPVITTGGSDYASATIRVRTPEELVDVLDRRAWNVVNTEDIKKFLWVYTKRYMVHCDDTEAMAARLGSLLRNSGFPVSDAFPTASLSVDLANPAEIQFCEVPKSPAGTRLPEPLRRLCADLEARGVDYWLEAEALAAVVEGSKYVKLELPVDVGIWNADVGLVQEACKSVAKSLRMNVRVSKLDDAVIELGLRSSDRSKRGVRIRVYRREGEYAWATRKVSLIARRAGYAQLVYRRENGKGRASPLRKLSFVVAHPLHGACLLAAKAGMAPRVAAWTASRGRVGRRVGWLLRRLLRIQLLERVPVHYFDGAGWFEYGALRYRTPAGPSEYLRARHGEPLPEPWQNYVADAFACETNGKLLGRMLAASDALSRPSEGADIYGERST